MHYVSKNYGLSKYHRVNSMIMWAFAHAQIWLLHNLKLTELVLQDIVALHLHCNF